MVPLELFVVNIQSSAVDIHLTVRRSQLTGCSGENPHGLRSIWAHHFRSIWASRSWAHHLCSIGAGRPRAHHLCSIRAGRPERTTYALSELVAPERIRSTPPDDGSSDEDVIVVNSDDTTLTLSHDHSLFTASFCVKLTSARMECSRRAASYMYAVHIAVDQHALLVAWTRRASCCTGEHHIPGVWRTCQACDELFEHTRTSTACSDHLAAWAHSTSCCTLTLCTYQACDELLEHPIRDRGYHTSAILLTLQWHWYKVSSYCQRR